MNIENKRAYRLTKSIFVNAFPLTVPNIDAFLRLCADTNGDSVKVTRCWWWNGFRTCQGQVIWVLRGSNWNTRWMFPYHKGPISTEIKGSTCRVRNSVKYAVIQILRQLDAVCKCRVKVTSCTVHDSGVVKSMEMFWLAKERAAFQDWLCSMQFVIGTAVLKLHLSIVYSDLFLVEGIPLCYRIKNNTKHIAYLPQQCHNSKFVIFQENLLKVLKCCNFLWVQRRHNCSQAANFANCVMTLYLLKVHLQTFLSIPITQKCQILSCDTLVANERYMFSIS
jgi:hypothetical protein